MATPTPNQPTPGVQVSKLREIGDARRVELQQIAPQGYDKININNPYVKGHPYMYSEGINGDNHGKEPQQPPKSYEDAIYNIGGKDDIRGRISPDSPGTLAQNTYRPGKEYKVSWNS